MSIETPEQERYIRGKWPIAEEDWAAVWELVDRLREQGSSFECPDCRGDGGFDDPRVAEVRMCGRCGGTGLIRVRARIPKGG